MSRRGSFRRLSIALAAALSFVGANAAHAAAGVSPSPSPFPSPTSSPTPVPSPSPTPWPSPSPTATGAACQPPPAESAPADQQYGVSAVQDEIETVAGRISVLVDQNGYTGFTGLIADPDNARLLLCWLGTEALPGPVAGIVANPGEPITVVRQYAAHSNADLSARVDTILANSSLGAQVHGSIHTVTVPEEGTGLIATVLPDDPTVDPVQFAAQAQPVLSAAAGVPVTVQVGEPVDPTTRVADSSPWYGGGRLTDNAGNPTCSSGFGIVRRSDSAQFLLTAYHCFAAQAVFNGQPVGNANRRQIGTVTIGVPAGDSEAIAIAAPGTAGAFVYVGGVSDATEGIARVTGVGINIPNLLVCTSGSFSGEHCLLSVTRTNVFFTWTVRGNVIRVGPVNRAVTIRRGPPAPVANAGGNSGGPVILRGESLGQVDGMGTIIGSSRHLQFPCMVYDATVCYTDVIYNKLSFLMVNYGAALP